MEDDGDVNDIAPAEIVNLMTQTSGHHLDLMVCQDMNTPPTFSKKIRI